VADPLQIKQGTTRFITIKGLRDDAGNILDPTGWDIHGVARPGLWADETAVWRDSPGVGEHLAEVVDADPDIDPTVLPGEKWIDLHIDPDVSDAWTWGHARLDVEIREPSTDREETFTADLQLIPTTVRNP
jgi:hypothetical protein